VNLDEKKKIVEDLHDRFSRSKVVIVTDYKGLDVAKTNELRRKLREAGVEFRVVKNSLLVRAAEETGVASIRDHFKGPSAVALSYDDPVAPAKVLTAFAKDNDKLAIKVGVMGGRVLGIDRIKALAELPSHETLLAELLSALNGVPSGFVRTLSAIPAQFLNVLQAIKEQKEAA
jgi:large subunit ribosomal protein L10